MENIIPKEITVDSDDGTNIASFGYYDGIEYAKQHNLQHTVYFSEVRARTHYLVCCGDVMIIVLPTDYPEITRRVL